MPTGYTTEFSVMFICAYQSDDWLSKLVSSEMYDMIPADDDLWNVTFSRVCGICEIEHWSVLF